MDISVRNAPIHYQREQCKVFDSLPQLEETLPYDVKSTLVYIAGYVTREDDSDVKTHLIMLNSFGDSLLVWEEVV